MRRTGLSSLAAAGILAVVGVSCFKDPVTSLQSTTASRLVVTETKPSGPIGQLTNVTITNKPDTNVINVQAVDPQGNYLTIGQPTFTSADPTVASVIAFPDTTIAVIPGSTLWKAEIVAGAQFGVTTVTVSAAGLTDTISVINLPTKFQGTINGTAAASVHPADTITFAPPAGMTFGPTATATFGQGPNFFVSRTATALKYVAGAITINTATGASIPLTATINGLLIAGNTVVPTGVPTTATLTVIDNNEPADNTSAGAVAMGTIAAVGDSLVAYGSIDGGDAVGDYLKFQLNVSDSLAIRIDFKGSGAGTNDANPDLDLVICTNSSCTYGTDLAGNAASATNNPEVGKTPVVTAPTTVYLRVYSAFTSSGGATGYRVRVKAL